MNSNRSWPASSPARNIFTTQPVEERFLNLMQMCP